ncbi:CAP domain-containing protein [Parasegetibacter sp. NRK P23]|uniref:CAP domain-containing protein n=1 Tax=Parasegetibacter sp. NRK P23 TaxID=2942999 RepID=UPI002043A4F5|nr:CAP domain-containing protein [Parasegetibacter sp. NRK P23]MCM5528255.1 CAP domain-containing protein [Parasegetibacter sp. NRK P23]
MRFRSALFGSCLLLTLLIQERTALAAERHPVLTVQLVSDDDNDPADMESEILELVNKHRKKKNLPPLQWNSAMAKAAEQHSANMAKKKTAFGHNGFEARVKKIASSEGMLKGWAENVAFGNLSAEEVVKGWLKSPGHKKNIEGKYNLMGVGIARSKSGELYFTQIFGLK